MTNRYFIKSIIEYYRESRKLTIEKGTYNIWRGVNHSISSQSEDLFALMIAEELQNNSLEFIVDKTMSLKIQGEKSIQFRPDLAIVKDGKLTHIIDLKMDMGYKRRYFETPEFKKEAKKFEILRTQSFLEVTYNRGAEKLKVSKNIINQVVVISEKNEGKSTNRTEMIDAIDKLDWVNIYYLTGDVHPNNYSDTTLKDIRINDEVFDKLFKDIKNQS